MTEHRRHFDKESARKIDEIKNVILAECGVDHVGLWLIVAFVRDDFGSDGPERVRAISMNIARELLSDDSIRAGQFVTHETGTSKRYEFIEWGLGREQTIARIEREWDELGKDPNPGDIVWFTVKSRCARAR